MSHDSIENKGEHVSVSTLVAGLKIRREVERIYKESIRQILLSSLPPDLAKVATMPTFDEHYNKIVAEREKKALEAAKAGEGPQPYDRDWYNNGWDFDDLISDFDWHLTNDFLDLTKMALSSAEGQRALAQREDPNNPRQHVLDLLLGLRRSLLYRQRDLLYEQGANLNWDSEMLEEMFEEISEV
jgi:hypothetical protein